MNLPEGFVLETAPQNGTVDRILTVESGNNPNAKNQRSSATGAGQFLDATWLETIARHRPDLRGRNREELLALRNDPNLSREMTAAYANDNANMLRGAGFDPTPENTYLAHFAGPRGALNVLQANPQMPVERILGPQAVAANPFLRGMTAGDLRKWAQNKMQPGEPMQLQGYVPEPPAGDQWTVRARPAGVELPPGFQLEQPIRKDGDVLSVEESKQLWGDTDRSATAQNKQSTLDPRVDQIIAERAANDPKARVEQYIRNREKNGQQAGWLDAALHGATFGLSDEIGAVLERAAGGDYDTALAGEREALKRYQKDHPIRSTAFEVGGGLITAPLLPGAAPANAARGVRALHGAAQGGLGGAIYGFNTAEDGFENRVKGGALGAIIGAPVGGAVGAILPGIKAAPATTPGSEVAAAAERVGVNLPRAVTSDNRSTQQIGKIVSNIPLSGLPLRNASERAIGQLDEAINTVRQGYGNSNAAMAGQGLREGLENYIGPLSTQTTKKFYDRVDNLVNPNTVTPLNQTKQVAQDILSRRNNAAIDQASDAVRRITTAINRPGLNYSGIKDLRSWIGELVDTGVLPVDLSKAELKQIYGALTQDLESAVRNAGGPQALSAWQRANTHYRLLSGRRENLARILGAKNDEGVFDRLLAAASNSSRGDQALLAQARKAMPANEWNEVASAVILRLGRDPGGNVIPGQAVTPAGFSPDRFMTAYGKLTPAGKSILFRSTGQGALANSLDDIARVSQRFKQLNTFANPSGTGQTVAGTLGGAGLITDPVTTLGTIMSSAVMAQLLSRPQSARSIANWSNAYYNAFARPTRATMQLLERANRIFADDIGRQLGVPQHAESLFRQLQGAIPARADGEQKQ